MHSIAPVRSASGAAQYFANDDFVSGEYYTDEQAGDVSVWGGSGASHAGLQGHVAKEAFAKVLAGDLPGGERLDPRESRRPGFDLTFSAPKSVSVMAYVAQDTRILGANGAHASAVRQTMAWVERTLAEARRTVDGKTVPIRTGNLVYALFQHDTSRSLDPQAHVHAVVANMTRMPDGSWRALHADKIWSNNSVIGSVYHAYLRAEMAGLGYVLEARGKHGGFEIAGVPRAVVDAFSQRREAILLRARELGIKSTQGLRDVTARTRDPKVIVGDRTGLLATWQAKAAALGFNGVELLAAAERAAGGRAAGPLERGFHVITEAVRGARDLVSGLLRSPDPLVDRGIANLARSPEDARAQLAVASAVRKLGQREAAFDANRIVKEALDFALPGVTADHVEARVVRLLQRGQLLPGQIRVDGATIAAVTTPEALRTEERILAAAGARRAPRRGQPSRREARNRGPP